MKLTVSNSNINVIDTRASAVEITPANMAANLGQLPKEEQIAFVSNVVELIAANERWRTNRNRINAQAFVHREAQDMFADDIVNQHEQDML